MTEEILPNNHTLPFDETIIVAKSLIGQLMLEDREKTVRLIRSQFADATKDIPKENVSEIESLENELDNSRREVELLEKEIVNLRNLGDNSSYTTANNYDNKPYGRARFDIEGYKKGNSPSVELNMNGTGYKVYIDGMVMKRTSRYDRAELLVSFIEKLNEIGFEVDLEANPQINRNWDLE